MYLCFCLIERMISLNIIYKKATIDDIVLLTKTRIEVLRAANNLTSDIDMDEVERKTYEYYKEAFQNDTHTAYMVFEDNKFVGAGGVSYYQVMPTYHNPSGKKAYIMNMYTAPVYEAFISQKWYRHKDAGITGRRCKEKRHYFYFSGSNRNGQTFI